MVAAPLSYSSGQTSGPRPIDLRKDIPQVLALLNLVFRASGDRDASHALNRTSLAQQPWFILRLRQWYAGVVPGYVWEESGSIVGNVSVLTTKKKGRFLVANVAVHPQFRRQGIARKLMETVVRQTSARGGHELLLQVRRDNEAAIKLYESIDFEQIGSLTSWYSSFRQFRLLPAAVSAKSPDHSGDFFIRPLRSQEWRRAYEIDTTVVHPDLNWPDQLAEDHYRSGPWRWFSNMINARQAETWVAETGEGKLAGLAAIQSEWGRLHTMSLRTLPEWRGKVELPLLAKLLRRLQHMYRRDIRIDHPAADDVATELLRRANFVPRRTLTTMLLSFD